MALDTSFNTIVDGYVIAITKQSDGKILIGGTFENVNGVPRSRVARLNSDGTLDTSFTPPTIVGSYFSFGAFIYSINIQSDNNIIISGAFSTVGGVTRNNIARLTPTGSLDTSFNANIPTVNGSYAIYTANIQTDGKVLIGGNFNVSSRNYFVRLTSTGAVDTAFNPNSNLGVAGITLQSDGKIIVSGDFGTIGGQSRSKIARLNSSDGSADSFDPNVTGTIVYKSRIQSDSSIVFGGAFTQVSGQTRNNIAKVSSSGVLDSTFNPNASDGSVIHLEIQSDSKIIVSGGFTNIGGQNRNYLARLDPITGLADTWNPNPLPPYPYDILIESDGNVLIGGYFTEVYGVARTYIARLTPSDFLYSQLERGTRGLNRGIFTGGSF